MGRLKQSTEKIQELLDKVESNEFVTVDSALSTESENPVMNKVITEELGKKATTIMLSTLETKVDTNKEFTDTKLAELSDEVEEINEKIGNLPQGASMTTITYADLVVLRDNGGLIAGMQYRITDYVTTTAQENTRSAGHQFDVIVTADNENTLNEVARACLHEGDTYFSEAGANLAAWQIWYSLDNDAERFAWADAENGKGVIYRMIDEFNNDCPYDFKNIMFKRYILDAENAVSTEVSHGGEQENVKVKLQTMSHKIHTVVWYYGEYITDIYPDANLEARYVPFGDMDYTGSGPQVLCEINESSYGWFYTFHNEDRDVSLLKPDIDEGVGVYGNTIKENNTILLVEYGSGSYYTIIRNAQILNNMVFITNSCYGNTFGKNCYGNSFDARFNNNIFRNNIVGNTFGNECYNNSFDNDCCYNSFGNSCYSNSFSQGCYCNSFGDYFNNNSFGKDCSINEFGIDCYGNHLSDCCTDNHFGNNCCYNLFGNLCNGNRFTNNSGLADRVYYNKIDNNVQLVIFFCDCGNEDYQYIQNHHVCNGLNNRTVELYSNREYETTFAITSGGNVREFVLADLKAS